MNDDEAFAWSFPAIPDNLHPDQKNALAILNVCWFEGTCPSCGTTAEIVPGRDHHPEIPDLMFNHKPDCPSARDFE